MVVIECLLRKRDLLVPVHEARRYDGQLEYLEGVLHLVVDGVELIGRRDQDLVDQLWSYLLEGLRVVLVERGAFDGFFPDQPLPIRMRYLERDRILLRIGKRALITGLGAFAEDFVHGAEVFCDQLARLVGESHVAPIRAQAMALRPHLEHVRHDIVYRSHWSVDELLAVHQQASARGVRVVCHRCGLPLIFAVTPAEARRQGVHGGVFCPRDQYHVGILFEFEETRRELRSRLERRTPSRDDD